ncbi:hypothetical protein L1D15_09295 [Vibrio sp. Isolate25]|uniref:hypothetical protein n=1 Tax=Vibrio sp. Isolate25 TaxID=2908535 RepID=UPI001EFE02E2|nr:hypothetical protein [Vibrio sp. Isolate25]MCG9596918.1 hypothetical protein [Vibrio sp. Isolate25]
MKWIVWLLLVFVSESMAGFDPHIYPEKVLGILEIDDMTSGELLWLRGRVGEGNYTWVNRHGHHCTMKIPVAVGQKGESGLGIGSAEGIKIVVRSQALNKALIQGERVSSQDWQFSALGQSKDVDGWIVDGIGPEEEFVLNSRKRWISWLLGKTRNKFCR